MNVLITGSHGFIGSKLAECLHGEGYSVFCLVRDGSKCHNINKGYFILRPK